MQAVISGEVDVGALNFVYYDKAKPEEKAQAPIIYTTPKFVDYCWIGHARLGDEVLQKIKAALLKLDAKKEADKAVLDGWGAGKYVAADKQQWDGIRKVLQALPKDFLKYQPGRCAHARSDADARHRPRRRHGRRRRARAARRPPPPRRAPRTPRARLAP